MAIFMSILRKKWHLDKPYNLGDIVNISFHERVPSITPDGIYFFSRYNKEDGFANLYWVSTQVIENIIPKQ
jgi:hypothetical protein